jgi:hypothetical protein
VWGNWSVCLWCEYMCMHMSMHALRLSLTWVARDTTRCLLLGTVTVECQEVRNTLTVECQTLGNTQCKHTPIAQARYELRRRPARCSRCKESSGGFHGSWVPAILQSNMCTIIKNCCKITYCNDSHAHLYRQGCHNFGYDIKVSAPTMAIVTWWVPPALYVLPNLMYKLCGMVRLQFGQLTLSQ